MLEAIRTHSKSWIAKLILVLITIPFALWGIDSYFATGSAGAAVATVGDLEITERDFSQALQNQRDAIQSQGGNVDIDNKEFRTQVLNQLVDTRLMTLAANQAGIFIPEGQVMGTLSTIPQFQDNGAFSEAKLDAWLRNRAIGRGELLNMIHEEALMRQLQFGYGEGSVVATTAAGLLAKQLAQKREVSEAAFSASSYAATVKVEDAAVEAEYKANPASYTAPEQIRVRYVVLSMAEVADQIQVAEDKVKEYYEANKARYTDPEQRRASHILIKTEPGMDAAAKAAAKAKAEQLLKDLRQSPGKFADMAIQHSQDPGSGSRGGDLGFFTRDMMVKPFADAVYGMKVDQISDLVESEFGYHIIRLDGINPGTVQGYAVVKQDIINELKAQEAHRKFAEVADRFSNMVYEQPDSLDPVVRELGLKAQDSGWISKDAAEPGLLRNPRLLDAMFSPDAVEQKHNTEAIDVAPDTLVSARVLEHKPAALRPLAEVSADIRQRLASQAARAKAIEQGKAALASAQSGNPGTGFGPVQELSRMQPTTIPLAAVKSIFQASTAKLPTYVGVETPDGYRVYRISKVTQGDAPEGQASQIQRDLTRLVAQEELRAYMEYVRARAKVEINETALERKVD